jgi:hypothetical protein
MKLKDAETGQYLWVDTSDPNVRGYYSNWWEQHNTLLDNAFTKTGVDIQISTPEKTMLDH